MLELRGCLGRANMHYTRRKPPFKHLPIKMRFFWSRGKDWGSTVTLPSPRSDCRANRSPRHNTYCYHGPLPGASSPNIGSPLEPSPFAAPHWGGGLPSLASPPAPNTVILRDAFLVTTRLLARQRFLCELIGVPAMAMYYIIVLRCQPLPTSAKSSPCNKPQTFHSLWS